MGLLQKLLSTLGLGNSGSRQGRERRQGDTTVTVEHEPNAKNESAVKGTEGVATGTAASGSTATITDTADEDVGAAEPSDAAGPSASAHEENLDETGPDTTVEEAEPASTATEEADAEDTDTQPDDAPTAGSDESPDVLNGIGPAYAERLEDAGIGSVADLADADASVLAEETGLGEGRIANWIEQAKEY